MKKGQVSFEYVALVGILLVLLIPLFYYAGMYASERIKMSQAEDTVGSLGKAIDDVYALSPGTKKKVWVIIPGSVKSIGVTNKELTMVVNISGRTNHITYFLKADAFGQIPTEKGTYNIPIELLESGLVLVGEGNDITFPAIVWKSPEGNTCNPITLRVNTDEAAKCKFDLTDESYGDMDFWMFGNALGHSFSQGVQNQGSYQYFVLCNDSAGNLMSSSDQINYVIDFGLC